MFKRYRKIKNIMNVTTSLKCNLKPIFENSRVRDNIHVTIKIQILCKMAYDLNQRFP